MVWEKIKRTIVIGVGVLLAAGTASVAIDEIQAHRVYPGLAGLWEGTNSNQRVALKIDRTNGVYTATFDYIDSGVDIPARDLKPGNRAISFRVAASDEKFTASIDPAMTVISGNWLQGTNRYPVALKRMAQPDIPGPLAEADFAPRPGSDLQGFWRGTIKLGGWQFGANIKIAEPAAGKFRAELDGVEWGGRNIPAASMTRDGSAIKMAFCSLGSFEGNLDAAAGQLAGNWTRGTNSNPVTFRRVDYQAEQASKNYTAGSPWDLQGHWKGILKLPDGKLHFVFHIAQLPDGSFSATMDNPDQGANDIVARSAQYTPPHVSILWNGTGGVFNGALKDGKLTGTWKQGRRAQPLTLSRD